MHIPKKVMIDLYGIGTASHQFLRKSIIDQLESLDVEFTIEDHTDLEEFISRGIESIPAVSIDGRTLLQAKDFSSLTELTSNIAQYVKQVYLSSQ